MIRENIKSKLIKGGRNNYEGIIIEKFNGKYYLWDSAAMIYSCFNINAEALNCYALDRNQYKDFMIYLTDKQIMFCTVELESPVTKNRGVKFLYINPGTIPENMTTLEKSIEEPRIKSDSGSDFKKNDRFLVIDHFKKNDSLKLEDTVLIEKKANSGTYRLYDIDAKICCRIFGREEKNKCILNKSEYYNLTSKLKSENVYYFVYELDEIRYKLIFKKVEHYNAQVNQYSKIVDKLLNPSKKVVSDEFIRKQEEAAKLNDQQVRENRKTMERLKNSPPTDKPTNEDMRRARWKDFFKN